MLQTLSSSKLRLLLAAAFVVALAWAPAQTTEAKPPSGDIGTCFAICDIFYGDDVGDYLSCTNTCCWTYGQWCD